MNTKSRRRKKRKPIRVGQLVLFFIFLAVLSIIIAFFIVRPDKEVRHTTPTKIHQTSNTNDSIKISNPLMGTWVSNNDGSILEIHAHHFSIEIPSVDQHMYREGQCEITKTQIQFIYSDTLENCLGKIGTYRFKIKEKQLILSPIKETCPGRSEHLSASWERF